MPTLADSPPDPDPAAQPAPGADEDSPIEASKFLPKIVKFTDLPRCGDEMWIEHNGQLYRLRSTRQGKLILTK